jgi:hypothetical protein
MKISYTKKYFKYDTMKAILASSCCFMLGCILTASVMLNVKINSVNDSSMESTAYGRVATANSLRCLSSNSTEQRMAAAAAVPAARRETDTFGSILRDLKVLVVIVAFDFSQLPHLEEVLSAYHDLCTAGSHVDVIVHATVAYPVTLIDLLNTRITCPDFRVTIALKPKSLRLFLVDLHRQVFYDNIHEYDLFIYTEDDIRVTPTTVATYVTETQRLQTMLDGHKKLKPSDFNVGIVRYEYNYPANLIMDDNTRHATQNVTRVSYNLLSRISELLSLVDRYYVDSQLCFLRRINVCVSVGVLGTQRVCKTCRWECGPKGRSGSAAYREIHYHEKSSPGHVLGNESAAASMERETQMRLFERASPTWQKRSTVRRNTTSMDEFTNALRKSPLR